MDAENNFESEKMVKLTQFKDLQEKSMFLKIAVEAFEAGDFLNIFLRFFGFWGLFSYKKFSYKKKMCTGPTKRFDFNRFLTDSKSSLYFLTFLSSG